MRVLRSLEGSCGGSRMFILKFSVIFNLGSCAFIHLPYRGTCVRNGNGISTRVERNRTLLMQKGNGVFVSC